MNKAQRPTHISSAQGDIMASELKREIQKLHDEAKGNPILREIGNAALEISLGEQEANNSEDGDSSS